MFLPVHGNTSSPSRPKAPERTSGNDAFTSRVPSADASIGAQASTSNGSTPFATHTDNGDMAATGEQSFSFVESLET